MQQQPRDPDRLVFTHPWRIAIAAVLAWVPLLLAWALLVVMAVWLGGAP